MFGELIRQQAKQALGSLIFVRTATKRAAGSRTSMKDSAGRRLGMKRSDGQPVKAGEIIYRQRGTKFYPGENTDIGKDHTIWAKEPGFVKFYYDPFHPKRKLIGVALKREYELPTPHFEPRRRRLGHVPITTERAIEEEKQWLPRKEQISLEQLTQEIEKRNAVRAERLSKLKSELSEYLDEVSDASVQRLLDISIYMAGGRDLNEARKLVDAAYIFDLEVAADAGRMSLEESAKQIEEYRALAAKVDSSVAIDSSRRLFKASVLSELEELATKSIAELDALTASAELPLNKDIKQKVMRLIDQPCFDKSTQTKLQRKYVRFAPPELIKDDDALKQVEARVKKGEGEIVKSWNYEARRVDSYFLPKGTPKMAII